VTIEALNDGKPEPPPGELPPGVERLGRDLLGEARSRRSLPQGETSFSLARSHRFQRDTLRFLLEKHEQHGAVFTLRILHRPIVMMLGPEANHFVTVAGAQHFSWRRGMYGEQLIPLIGDGLITTDGAYHDYARQTLMPSFHRRRLGAAATIMVEETERALQSWRRDEVIDIYAWARELTMSIAMRALLGLDPRHGLGREFAERFEQALSFYDVESWMMLLRGPGTPWASAERARRGLDAIITAEIARRRGQTVPSDPAEEPDILTMLLEARDGNGRPAFTDGELRDHVATLLFGAHDTSSSTLSFMLYELARHPDALDEITGEQHRVLDGSPPTVEQLLSELPQLDMALDETLRLYPPVWFGPRQTVSPFEFAGHKIPAGVHVFHSSWVTHHLPDVFPDPEGFIPARFTPVARTQLPKGAYMPFGGGQRICIGKRFGQLLVKTAATTILQNARLEPIDDRPLQLSKAPTLSPQRGLPMLVSQR
jgi:cytochrome P450